MRQVLQRSARTAQTPAIAPPLVHDVLRGAGEPLDRETREFMEPRFQHDFSRVRVHQDEDARRSAEAVHARAYTVGSHIVLGESPSRALLAHELAHVVQQHAFNHLEMPAVQRRIAGNEVAADGSPAAQKALQSLPTGDMKCSVVPVEDDKTGVHTTVEFKPHAGSVECDKIDFIQSVRIVDLKKSAPVEDLFRGRRGKSAIDRKSGWPYYTKRGAKWRPSDTKRSTHGAAGSGGLQPKAAFMRDAPGGGETAETYSFNSCAVCRAAAALTAVYGCASWGFTTDSTGVVKKIDVPIIQSQPNADFLEARKTWNEWAKKRPLWRRQIPELEEAKPRSKAEVPK